ncbi:MAG: WG repeat-containing protein [Rikenellaceae bacterium]|nr:WG repeat-containing protein [Rikenellaceae bacterium]
MQLPTISQYAGSVSDPAGLTRTLGEFIAERDYYGEVRIRTGNNACVFSVTCADRKLMLKCYIRPRNDLRAIYDYITGSGDKMFPDVRFLPDELLVFDHFGTGAYYDVVCGEWANGFTLDTEIRRACRENNRSRLTRLSETFDRLAFELLRREWAHGDIKPENIIVGPDGSMSLIDFDGLYFPDNPAPSHTEVGTPGYQHPARDESTYGKYIDDYPLALISVSIRALAADPSLYGRYNRADILLLNPAGISAGTCPAYGEVKTVLAHAGDFGHYRLALLLRNPHPRLEGLEGVFERIIRLPVLHSRAVVYTGDHLFGYADSEPADGGTILLDAIFDEACEFREDAALVTLCGERKLLSVSGKYLFGNLGYQDIKPFSEGLAAIRIDGLWGYIDRDGAMAVEPRFDAAGSMHCGFAVVSSGGRWGYVGRDGKMLTDFIFDRAFGFRNGFAEAYTGDKLFNIDTRGNIIERETD